MKEPLVVLGLALLAAAVYCGVRSLILIVRALGRLGRDKNFGRVAGPDRLMLALSAPSTDPSFRRYSTLFLVFGIVAIIVLANALPKTSP